MDSTATRASTRSSPIPREHADLWRGDIPYLATRVDSPGRLVGFRRAARARLAVAAHADRSLQRPARPDSFQRQSHPAPCRHSAVLEFVRPPGFQGRRPTGTLKESSRVVAGRRLIREGLLKIYRR